MRHPVYLGLREDKLTEDLTREREEYRTDKKRAGLAPENASIPRAFGYTFSRGPWLPNCHLTRPTGPLGRVGRLFPVLIERLRHFKMVLQRRQGLPGPVLELGIFTALRIALKQRHCVRVGAHLHGIIL
jgi:hypothetical protein